MEILNQQSQEKKKRRKCNESVEELKNHNDEQSSQIYQEMKFVISQISTSPDLFQTPFSLMRQIVTLIPKSAARRSKHPIYFLPLFEFFYPSTIINRHKKKEDLFLEMETSKQLQLESLMLQWLQYHHTQSMELKKRLHFILENVKLGDELHVDELFNGKSQEPEYFLPRHTFRFENFVTCQRSNDDCYCFMTSPSPIHKATIRMWFEKKELDILYELTNTGFWKTMDVYYHHRDILISFIGLDRRQLLPPLLRRLVLPELVPLIMSYL
jgi:hypothetical protein